MSNISKKQEVDLLFKKFSHSIMKPAITSHQSQVALGIAKILWLLFITKKDSEKNVYHILDQILKNHENNVSFGSLYFFKMKPALTEDEARRVFEYYSNEDNFNELKLWVDQ